MLAYNLALAEASTDGGKPLQGDLAFKEPAATIKQGIVANSWSIVSG